MNNPPELSEIEGLVERELCFLANAGYVNEGFFEDDYQHLTWEWIFTNEGLNRRVRVVLFKNDPPRVATSSIDLVEQEPREWDDYTSLGVMHVCRTDLRKIDGSLIDKMSQHLKATTAALTSAFAEVVAGRFWKTDHLDWGDQK